jgi:outer membrane cobalamin receptor
MRRQILLISAAVGIGACASKPSSEATPGQPAPAQRGSANVITQAEIERTSATTALEVIERLRPAFLQTRGGTSMTQRDMGIAVYVDGTPLGDVSALSRISAVDVKRIEYLSATEATQRYGTGHVHGAILITRK